MMSLSKINVMHFADISSTVFSVHAFTWKPKFVSEAMAHFVEKLSVHNQDVLKVFKDAMKTTLYRLS